MQGKFKKRALHRLHIVQGQLRGLEKMIERNEACSAVLTQSAAAQKSLASFNQLMLESDLLKRLGPSGHGPREEEAVADLLRLYKLSNPIL